MVNRKGERGKEVNKEKGERCKNKGVSHTHSLAKIRERYIYKERREGERERGGKGREEGRGERGRGR